MAAVSKGDVQVGEWQVRPQLNEIEREGEIRHLEPRVMDVLVYFASHAGEVLTKEHLIQAVWPDTFVTDDALKYAIVSLRKVLDDDAAEPAYVRTIPRRGYQLAAEVRLPERERSSDQQGPTERSRKLVGASVIVAGLALCVGGLWALMQHFSDEETFPPPRVVPLTSYPGRELRPSFSPDGTQVAFMWDGERQDNWDIWIKQIGVEPPFRLTTDPGTDFSPAWSPDGTTIAFLRLHDKNSKVSLILVQQRGGAERVLATYDLPLLGWVLLLSESESHLAWTSDSEWLAFPAPVTSSGPLLLHLVSVATGGQRRLTSPPNQLVNATTDTLLGEAAPAFSPDGCSLLFSREYETKADLLLQKLDAELLPTGEPVAVRRDFEAGNISAARWMSDDEIVVGYELDVGFWKLEASPVAKAQKLEFVPNEAKAPTLSTRGHRLAYSIGRRDSNIWRIDLTSPDRPAVAAERFISSTRDDRSPSFSPDGKKVAFLSDRSGTFEVWTCNADGSDAMQLTHLGPSVSPVNVVRWSPDGRRLVADLDIGKRVNVFVLSADGASPRQLSNGSGYDKWPTWSPDGQSVYFISDQGGTAEVWKVSAEGGEPVQVTRDPGADLPYVSPDGRFLYYRKGWPHECVLWKLPIEGGAPLKILDGIDPISDTIITRDGIYLYFEPDEKWLSTGIRLPVRRDLLFYDFSTSETRQLATIDGNISWPVLAVSPDGQTILYSQSDDIGSDLMLVEDFR